MNTTTASAASTPTLESYDVPEVAEFLAADSVYQAFKARHEKLMEEFTAIANRRNEKLEAASKAVRARGVSCGPFQLTGRPYHKIDSLRLIEHIGKDAFLRIGGKATEVTEYSIDHGTLSKAVASGDLKEDVAKLVDQRVTPYRSIPTVTIP